MIYIYQLLLEVCLRAKVPFGFERHLFFSRGGKDEAVQKIDGQGYGPGCYMLPTHVGSIMGDGAKAPGPVYCGRSLCDYCRLRQ